MTNGSDLSIHNMAETHPHVTDAAVTEKNTENKPSDSESYNRLRKSIEAFLCMLVHHPSAFTPQHVFFACCNKQINF